MGWMESDGIDEEVMGSDGMGWELIDLLGSDGKDGMDGK